VSAARKKGLRVERARYLGVDELPARPDRSTGLPRPPRAPGYSGTPLMGERGLVGAPNPPAGQGPVWVWYRGNRRDALAVAAWALVDSAGRRLTVKIKAPRSDRVIYDSVYNGILRSVIAGGARTKVPYPKPDSENGPRVGSNGDRRT